MITHEFSDRTNRRLGQLFLILALICLGLTYWAYSSDKEFIRTARLTKGEVIEVQKNRTLPTIRYFDFSGREVIFRPNTRSSADDFRIGEFVEVLHHDAVPSEARLNRWFHLWAKTFFAAFFCAILGVFAALTLSGRARWGPLKQTRFTFGGS